MGYFPNGIAGAWYEEAICERCVHYRPPDGEATCPVWMAHLLHNGAKDEMKQVLDMLIPRHGADNDLCAMWVANDPKWADLPRQYAEYIGKTQKDADHA